jgi:hypothetical protein
MSEKFIFYLVCTTAKCHAIKFIFASPLKVVLYRVPILFQLYMHIYIYELRKGCKLTKQCTHIL